MALEQYIEKRNFKQTSEPSAMDGENNGGLKFVVQKHHATHLHHDFRLEMEGVLKSWAVPKGPSLNPHDKRLAIMVEDHPYAYRTFEGTIPKGNYGAGIVEIWDEGTYTDLANHDRLESEKSVLEQLNEGSLKFVLHGKKLKGEFALVKIKNSDAKQDNAWLLIKHNDEYATQDSYNSEEDVANQSKIVKKKVDPQPDANGSATKRAGGKITATQVTKAMLHLITPMLAKTKEASFDSPEYIFEIKWDGYRAVAEIQNGIANLYSRNQLSFNQKFPLLVDALKGLGHNAMLDGEIVILTEQGISNFQLLQQYEVAPSPRLYYCVFDLLHLNGFDTTSLPLIERKKFLQEILKDHPHLKFSDHIESEGIAFYELARQNKLEGIIAKKANSPYRVGTRSDEWLKIKFRKSQEAIICGFTAPKNSRKYFGALVLGAYENNKLVYLGNVGSGFSEQLLESISEQLKPIVQPLTPFEFKLKTIEKITWAKPELVCDIAFHEWTTEGHFRQPVFQKMRTDKKAIDVTKEIESATVNQTANQTNTNMTAIKPKEENQAHVETIMNSEAVVNGKKLKLSNLNKIYWPEEGYTKGDLIAFYHKISHWILPYLKGRPQSLNRHPNGITGESFFQKDMPDSMPDWIKTQEIFSESSEKMIHYMLCQDEAALTFMNNLGCIEINPWSSRVQSLDNPDFVILDLDPGENTFDEVIETALIVKEYLDKAGATGYPKTSGASGIHIFIPLEAKYEYEDSKNFAHLIAQMVHAKLPKLTSLERSPKVRKKMIYIDYLQNRKGQTLAAPYSVRPQPGATVSTPLEWNELKPGLQPSQFDINNIFERLDKVGDLFAPVLGQGIDMSECLEKLR